MKSKTFGSVGALHPILFFAVMYVVVLFLSIFICSSIFYSFNGSSASLEAEQTAKTETAKPYTVPVSAAVVVR